MKLYLEGPGQERRPVRIISTEQSRSSAMADNSAHRAMVGIDPDIEMNTLMDEAGNIARQTDREGYRYKFEGSDIPWSLVVG